MSVIHVMRVIPVWSWMWLSTIVVNVQFSNLHDMRHHVLVT